MELITSIRKAIDYMEKHLTDNISAQEARKATDASNSFWRDALIHDSTAKWIRKEGVCLMRGGLWERA